ncbi:class I SAM-dependent methyltransferase [Aeromicrobium sp.]|uniref:class I SAM-dependent methyltransferase n=1 Tax=Aeromicrobium sp. TaxID=1871063 RepID=UPI0030C4F3A2
MLRADVAAAYDARADEYVAKLGSVEQMAPQDREAIESWRDATPGRFLDVGCGPGHWTDTLSADGQRDVVGVDAAARFVSSARERFPHIHFLIADLAAMPVATESVGGVLAWFSIIHAAPAEVPETLGELARVLTPGGSLLLGFFDGDDCEPFDHAVTTAYYWSAAALGELLAHEGFVVEQTVVRQDPGVRRQGRVLATRKR